MTTERRILKINKVFERVFLIGILYFVYITYLITMYNYDDEYIINCLG